MTESFFGNIPLPYECPACGQEFEETLAGMDGRQYVCPHCGALFDTEGGGGVAKELDEAIDDELGERFQ